MVDVILDPKRWESAEPDAEALLESWLVDEGDRVDAGQVLAEVGSITVREPIPRGHKVAVRAIASGGAVMKYGYKVPPYSETQEYVRRISKRYSLIRDPEAAANANHVTSKQIAGAIQKDSAPLSVYEPTVSMVRLPDGRLQLVSQ